MKSKRALRKLPPATSNTRHPATRSTLSASTRRRRRSARPQRRSRHRPYIACRRRDRRWRWVMSRPPACAPAPLHARKSRGARRPNSRRWALSRFRSRCGRHPEAHTHPPSDDEQARGLNSCFSAKELSLRTGPSVRSLLRWTNLSSEPTQGARTCWLLLGPRMRASPPGRAAHARSGRDAVVGAGTDVAPALLVKRTPRPPRARTSEPHQAGQIAHVARRAAGPRRP